MRREQRKIEEITRKNSEHLKDAFQHVARHQFDQTTEKKIMLRNLRHKVDVGLEAASRDLDIRRDKLRRMLLEEEDSLMKEYVDKAQKVNEKKLEEIKLRTQEIRNKREAERKKIVQEKRLQQYTERCEHIRSILSKRMLEEVKKGQQYQMKEREYLKEQEREAEKMWAEVAKKEYEAKVTREIADARRKFQRDKETAEMLLLQQKSIEAQNKEERQRILEEEVRMKKQIDAELRKEKMNALEYKLKERQRVFSDLMEQIKRREEFLNRMAKEEEILEKTFSRIAKAELDRELASKQDYRETLKRESQLYRDNLAELRRRRAQEEAELEKMLQQERDKVETQRKERAMKLKAARQKLKDDVLQGRKEQVEYNAAQEEKLRRAEEEEFKLQEMVRQQNARLTAEHDRQIKLLQKKYAQDLKDQIEYSKQVKARELEEIEREWKAGLLEEECYLRLIQELLGRPQKLEPHPFYRVIEASVSLDPPCKCPVPEDKEDAAPKR
ncbi:cilia- and flagella-associated protein 53-like isoform X2 [Periplaneta americana]